MRCKRWLWFVSLVVLFLVGTAATIAWYIATRDLMEGVADWRAGLQESGWQVAAGKPVAGGWPLAATVSVPDVTIGNGSNAAAGDIEWKAASIQLRISAWHPGTLVARLRGKQSLRIGTYTALYAAKQMTLAVPLYGNAAAQPIDVTVAKLGLGNNGGLRSLHALLTFRPAAQPAASSLDLSLDASSITLTGEAARPLGPQISHLGLEAELSGILLPTPDPKRAAANWHGSDGSIKVRNLQLLWGPLDLIATATLSLDDNLQPEGSGSVHAAGYAETLDALAAHAVLSQSTATAAKAVLSLLAQFPPNGGTPTVDIPLTLKGGSLAMHNVPLVRLPRIVWP